ncbi:MAG: HEAT repeat domain-containing protein [Candidatus Polarisedimenticolaceae bacterium]|nr:HEAT repeat domain-containing protein [Candidatus Polarisedimenticolaceae bacterium]
MPSPQSAIAALTHLLETGDEADRCYAAQALGVFGGNATVDVLIARLRDADIDVCVDAAEALGKIGSSRAIPPLIETLKHESSGEVCTAVTIALAALGGREASSALLEIAAQRPEWLEMDDDWDSWWDLQLEAIRGLGRAKEARTIAILIEIMDNHEHQDIESEVLKVLAQIGGQATDILIQRLQQGTPRSRRRAARALGAVRSAEASCALSRALQDDAAEVRSAAISALAEQGAEHYLPAILLLMRDESEAVRSAAIQSACQLASPADSLRELLLARLDDPSGTVRNGSLHALSATIEKAPLSAEMIQRVAASLEDSDPIVGSSVCALLSKCGDAATIPRLTALLAGSNRPPMLRRAAAQALGQIGVTNDDLLQALTEAIGDQEQGVCLAALTALIDLSAREEEMDSRPLDIVIAMLAEEVQVPPSEAEQEKAGAVEPTSAATQERSGMQPATSTLDAIAMESAQAMLDRQGDEGEAEPMDDETLHYLGLAERQKKEAERMQAERTFDLADDLRRLAARALAESRDAQAVAALATIVQNEPDAALTCEAISSLGNIAAHAPSTPGLNESLDLLIARLGSGDRGCRLAAARTLGQLGNRAAIAPLLAALADEAGDLRIEAVNAITELLMQEPGIDREQRVREGVATATIARQFLSGLDDAAGGVRLAVAKGLARLLQRKELQGFTEQAVEKMIAAALLDDGQQSRSMGRIIRVIQADLGAEKLLVRLEAAQESASRRPIIKMLEELFREPDSSAGWHS